MKHAQIVTTSPDVSPVTTGTLPPKPAPRSAQVLINILVPVQTKPAEAALHVAENTLRVNVKAPIHGAMALVLVPVLISILVPVRSIGGGAVRLVVENIRLVFVLATMFGTEVLVPSQTLV